MLWNGHNPSQPDANIVAPADLRHRVDPLSLLLAITMQEDHQRVGVARLIGLGQKERERAITRLIQMSPVYPFLAQQSHVIEHPCRLLRDVFS